MITQSEIEYLKKYLKDRNVDEAIKRVENGEPIQYVVGNVDFYGNILEVNKDVLIPRFETELLVEKTINYIKNIFDDKVDILDIGTGSGAIAITLAKGIDSRVVASDISNEALNVAKKNTLNNQVSIDFIQSDLFSNVKGKFDVIISNPPYISYDEEIMDVVKNNEPEIALYAKNDGLYYYEEILKECSKYLKDKFLIAFEIGYLQKDRVIKLAYQYLENIIAIGEKDLSGRDRYIFIMNKSVK